MIKFIMTLYCSSTDNIPLSEANSNEYSKFVNFQQKECYDHMQSVIKCVLYSRYDHYEHF